MMNNFLNIFSNSVGNLNVKKPSLKFHSLQYHIFIVFTITAIFSEGIPHFKAIKWNMACCDSWQYYLDTPSRRVSPQHYQPSVSPVVLIMLLISSVWAVSYQPFVGPGDTAQKSSWSPPRPPCPRCWWAWWRTCPCIWARWLARPWCWCWSAGRADCTLSAARHTESRSAPSASSCQCPPEMRQLILFNSDLALALKET